MGVVMVQLSKQAIQSDHAHWLNDFAAWNRDADRWQNYHDAALSEIRRLYTTIVALRSAVRGHADIINGYSVLCHHHAEATADHPEMKQCDTIAFVHEQMGARHAHLKETHERIGQLHGSVVHKLKQLEFTGAHREEGEICSTTP